MLSFLSLITIPSATSTFANISEWSGATFDEFFEIGVIEMGVVIGALLVVFIITVVIAAVSNFARLKRVQEDVNGLEARNWRLKRQMEHDEY